MPKRRETSIMDNRSHAQNFKFENFDSSVEEWEYYIIRFETQLRIFGFLTEDYKDEITRRNLLLARVGPEAFKILVDHHRPSHITDITYDVLKETLNKYYCKKVCIIAERLKFSMRHRHEGETIAQYVNTLRCLAGKCDFGPSLDERLRDQLILGINQQAWQQEMIKCHPDNSARLSEVENTVTNLEQACLHQQYIYYKSTENKTNKIKPQNYNRGRTNVNRNILILHKGVECFSCGNYMHKIGEMCPASNKTCSACK